jgi:hypothetical protein
MPAARVPGPDCGHSRGSPGHRAHGASPAKHAQKPQPTAQVVGVQVVGSSFRKEITFDRPISSVEASDALFHDAQHAQMLHPVDGSQASRTFILSMPDLATAYSLPNAVRNAILLGSVIQSTATPWDFPAWVPDGIRDDAKQGKITQTVTHYPSPQADWGDIVVWKGEADFQVYQEFPDDIRFYERLLGDSRKARLVRFAYTQYNQEMRDLVEGKGMAPEDARSEIRRINEEIFKLILEGVVRVFYAAAGITQVSNAVRSNSEQLASATARSARFAATEAEQSQALARLLKSQRNLQNSKVVRNSFVLDKPTVFRHSLFSASIRAAVFNRIKQMGKLLMSSGAGAHYGEGVYVYAVGKNVPSYIDVEVSAGVAVEELKVEGQGTFYRLVPPTENAVPVVIKGTNIPEDEIKTYEGILKSTDH